MARVKWFELIERSPVLMDDYLEWRSHKRMKIKSINRLAYIFLRSKYGLHWINWQREHFISNAEYVRILKTKWIKINGEYI